MIIVYDIPQAYAETQHESVRPVGDIASEFTVGTGETIRTGGEWRSPHSNQCMPSDDNGAVL